MPANQPPVEAIQGEARARAEVVLRKFGDGLAWQRGRGNDTWAAAIDAMLAFQSEARAVPSGGEREEPESAAWDWLDGKYLNVEAGHDPNDRAYSADEMVDAFIAGLASNAHQADREAIARVREAAQSVIDNAVSSYRSRGKDRYIEDDSGEKMMLVPHDDWYELQQALLLALSPTPSAGRDGSGAPPSTEKGEK